MKALMYAFLAFLAAAAAPATPVLAQDAGELRFVVDRSERKLYVRRGDEVIRTHPVAVGKSGHATPLGSWAFHQVDINPDWTPPDSDWSRDAEYTPPGHADNPMGRARLIFNRPYSIHGTEAEHSLGRAASHGSIRIANDVVLELAALLLREGGAWQGQSWFDAMVADPTEMHQITLDRPIPIEVVE
ncbi:MAG: L,D-transpeptidase [Allosphingosinicella sp.]|uniref:L,D-transpeptidase n=1 Tax=Allosphingosinicella sp. TaxID=2823234 RepID=UPI003950803E